MPSVACQGFLTVRQARFAAMARATTLRDRLKTALSGSRLRNQSDLAARVGVSRASVSDWFTGATQTIEGPHLTKAAEALGVDAHWLATGQQPQRVQETPAAYGMATILAWEHEHDLPAGEYVQIPSFEVRLAAGSGDEQRSLFQIEIEFLHAEPLAFRADWIRRMKLKPAKLAAMRVTGDSMENRLHDGDAVVVDTSQREVIDGKVYALWYDGGERVKRLYRRPGGGLLIHSDNVTKYPQLSLTPDEAAHVRIIGRVVHVSGEGGL